MDRPISGAQVTRVTLVEAAIRLFGERGYDAVSTREIADLAAANIGSIAYHFGGKPGLRRACAEHVISNIRKQIGTALTQPIVKLGQDEALGMIERTLTVFCRYWLTSEESFHFVNFLLREMMDPGEVSELFYCNWMKPMHIRFCTLVGLATGLDPNSEEAKIAVFSFVGQVFHFRLGRPLMMRRLEWDEMGEREANRLCSLMVRNARAIVMSYREAA
jgi:AcrR family transcriptional regulator